MSKMTIKELFQAFPAKKLTDTEHPAEREVGDDFDARMTAIWESREKRITPIFKALRNEDLPGPVLLIAERLDVELAACVARAADTKDETERWFYTVDQPDRLLAHHSAEAVAALD